MKLISTLKAAFQRHYSKEAVNSSNHQKFATRVTTALLVSSVCAMPALAGTGGDTLLKDAYDQTMGVAQGYGAKLTTGISGTFAMIGSVFKFQPQLIMSTLGVGFTGASIDNVVDFTNTGLLF